MTNEDNSEQQNDKQIDGLEDAFSAISPAIVFVEVLYERAMDRGFCR
jgi:hypothetical protein